MCQENKARKVMSEEMQISVSNSISTVCLQHAMIAHEVNRVYCQSIGDDSQPAWEDLRNDLKTSAYNGIRMWIKSGATDPSPAQSHESWMAAKLADGWVYGEVKDIDKKTHPCLVPYEDLPASQQVKDKLFGAVGRMAKLMVADMLKEIYDSLPDAECDGQCEGCQCDEPKVTTETSGVERTDVEVK